MTEITAIGGLLLYHSLTPWLIVKGFKPSPVASADTGHVVLAQARRFANDHLAEQLGPEALRKSATDELISLVPKLRRLPRRLDRISGSLEHGRLGLNV